MSTEHLDELDQVDGSLDAPAAAVLEAAIVDDDRTTAQKRLDAVLATIPGELNGKARATAVVIARLYVPRMTRQQLARAVWPWQRKATPASLQRTARGKRSNPTSRP